MKIDSVDKLENKYYTLEPTLCQSAGFTVVRCTIRRLYTLYTIQLTADSTIHPDKFKVSPRPIYLLSISTDGMDIAYGTSLVY